MSIQDKRRKLFQGHALQNHPLSFEFFCTSSEGTKEIVTEIVEIESLENKTKENKTLEQLTFPDNDLKNPSYILTEVEKTRALNYTITILDECGISDSSSTVVVAEGEKFELLEKSQKTVKNWSN